jgi:drug/metabolite transporter (DMT)-like permease
MSVYSVVLVSGGAATLLYLVLGVVTGSLVFDEIDVVSGLLGGLLGLIGTVFILKALAMGKMGVTTGVSQAYVLIPLAYSIFLGEAIQPLALVGVVVVLAGLITFILLHAKPAGGEGAGRGQLIAIFLALVSAVFWGASIVVLDVGSLNNIYGTLALSEVPQVVVGFGVAIAARSFGGLTKHEIAPLAGAGAALALGYVAFYTAAAEGDIGIVSVLAALSPVVTAILALIFLKERMNGAEIMSLVVILAGTAMVVI